MSKIEWTGETWNFLKGCNQVSAGCENCYAVRMAWRLQHNPKIAHQYAGTARKTAGGKIQWTGQINIDEQRMLLPISVTKPTVWFVNSMSDLFHEKVPFKIIDKAFAIMTITPQHTYQVLTKRPDIMQQWYGGQLARICTELDILADEYDAAGNSQMVERCIDASVQIASGNWPLKNVWMGVSVEDQATADDRIPKLLQVPAAVRFLSCEPLLSDINLRFFEAPVLSWAFQQSEKRKGLSKGIDWVIVGGESGPGARPMHPDWVREIREQCIEAEIAFFFKQWGEWAEHRLSEAKQLKSVLYKGFGQDMCKVGKKKSGRMLDGLEWNEMPVCK